MIIFIIINIRSYKDKSEIIPSFKPEWKAQNTWSTPQWKEVVILVLKFYGSSSENSFRMNRNTTVFLSR